MKAHAHAQNIVLLLATAAHLFPSTDLTELVEQEDTSTLGSTNRFHDPHSIWPALKLFDEQAVIFWQTVCLSPA
jgi:hypothetical protein